MSRRKRSNPWIAVLALGAGATVLGRNLWLTFGDPAPTTSSSQASVDDDLPPMGDEPQRAAAGSDSLTASLGEQHRAAVDLLAIYGSWQRRELPNAFPQNGQEAAAATPLVEPAPGDRLHQGVWDDDAEPAQLVVSLVMITAESRRASVDGTIVGIGDPVAGGKVARIGNRGIEVESAFGRLFYDMNDPYPREFRAELARRRAERERESGGDDAAAGDGSARREN